MKRRKPRIPLELQKEILDWDSQKKEIPTAKKLAHELGVTIHDLRRVAWYQKFPAEKLALISEWERKRQAAGTAKTLASRLGLNHTTIEQFLFRKRNGYGA